MKERIYRSKRYKDSIKELIQVSYGKINKKEISYQIIYREIREKISLYIMLKYLTKDDRFNCNLYITNIIKEKIIIIAKVKEK